MNFDENALQSVREDRFLINLYDQWLLEEINPFIGNRILEIGCGLGNMLQHFIDRELVVGLEISADSVAAVNQKFSATPNVKAYQLDITQDQDTCLAKYRFDTVVSLNVFEHMQDDDRAFRNASALLIKNGYLVMIVPAHMSLYGTMDRSIGHYRRYTKEMLEQKTKQVGLQVVKQKYINFLGALGWWINGRIFNNVLPPSGQLKLFNRLVPLLRTLEKIHEPMIGISVITIARKT